MTAAPNKAKALETARELMLAHGYTATTVDEICERAKISKGSFYHSFPTKEDLGLAVLEEYYEQGQGRLMAPEIVAEQDPKKRLLKFLKHAEANADAFWGEGCLLGNFAVELSQQGGPIRKKVSSIFSALTAQFATFFEPAAGKGKKGPGATELAEQFLAQLEGFIVLARAHNDPSYIARGIRRFRDDIEARL